MARSRVDRLHLSAATAIHALLSWHTQLARHRRPAAWLRFMSSVRGPLALLGRLVYPTHACSAMGGWSLLVTSCGRLLQVALAQMDVCVQCPCGHTRIGVCACTRVKLVWSWPGMYMLVAADPNQNPMHRACAPRHPTPPPQQNHVVGIRVCACARAHSAGCGAGCMCL